MSVKRDAAALVSRLFDKGFLMARTTEGHRHRADIAAVASDLGDFVQEQPGTTYSDGFREMRYCYDHGDVWISRNFDGSIECRVEHV